MLYTTCHDWLIDNSLLHKELAECKDVSGSVQVRVQTQSALITYIPDSFAVGFSDLTAGATTLASMFGIDMFNTLTKSFSFIGEELLELPESPSTQELIETPTIAFASSDTQFLNDKELFITQSYLLADAVVDISHKPLFSSSKSFEMPLCGTSAFALQLRFEPLIFTFDSTNLSAVEKLSFTCDYWIDNASVNSESLNDLNLLDIRSFSYEVEVDFTAFDAQSGRRDFPSSIRLEVGRDFDWQLDTPKSRGHADYTLLQEGFEGIVIESNCRELLFMRENLELLSLEHVTSLVSSSTDITAVESGKLLASSLVSGLVQLELVVGLELEALGEQEVTSLVVDTDSLSYPFVIRQNQLDCSLHSDFISSKYINPLEQGIYIPKGDNILI
jgi:hypothetical protein